MHGSETGADGAGPLDRALCIIEHAPVVSSRRSSSAIAAAIAFAVTAAAQQVWVVDAAGGPGVHFTDVQPAVFTAAPGDRIEVRGPAAYAGFAVDRGVIVEGVSGAIVDSIVFVGVPTGQKAAARGFSVTTQVLVGDCVGGVVLQDLTMTSPQPLVALKLTNSAQVYCRGIVIDWDGEVLLPGPAIRLDAASAVLEDCTVTAVRGAWYGTIGGAALHVGAASSAIVHGGTFTGGFGEGAQYQGPGAGCVGPGTAGPAIDGDGIVVVLGGASLQAGAVSPPSGGCAGGVAVPAVTALAAANVTIDPGCVVSPACAGCASASLVALAAPEYSLLGTTATIDAAGAAVDLVVVAGSLTQGHGQIPPFVVPWVLSSAPVVLGTLVLSPTGTASQSLTIPSQPVLAHLDLFFQGVSLSQGVLQMTGPTMLHTR